MGLPPASPESVNVAHIVERCRVLGPGERFVLWVQGCPLRCHGCHNPQFQPFEDKLWLSVSQLAARVLSVPDIEGVTYVGGEPFAQAEALAALSRRLHAGGLTVMTYTGFTLESLRCSALSHARELLADTDLLLDGPYRQDLPTARPWRGSDNQRLFALSDRYVDEVRRWNLPIGQRFEIHLSSKGEIEILGIPPLGLNTPEARCLF